jgi:hypothetical protein
MLVSARDKGEKNPGLHDTRFSSVPLANEKWFSRAELFALRGARIYILQRTGILMGQKFYQCSQRLDWQGHAWGSLSSDVQELFREHIDAGSLHLQRLRWQQQLSSSK